MIYHWVYDVFGAPGLFGMTVIFGLVFVALLAGSSYLIFFVWHRRRFAPDYRPDTAENKGAVLWSCYSVAGNAVFVLPVQLLIVFGNSRIYYEIEDYGWGYLIASFLGAIVASETLIYWIHRALHTRFLYRTVHVHHHRFREPTPLASVAFHPIDSFAQSFPYHIYALFVPVYFWLYLAMIVYVTLL